MTHSAPTPFGARNGFVILPTDQVIATLEWGAPEDEAEIRLLCLHGFMDNAATWNTLAPLLIERNPALRLVAIDLPGHGLSTHLPGSGIYSLQLYAMTVFGIVQELGWERFHLMGHSMGGAIATLFAGAMPERLHALIQVDIFGPWPLPFNPSLSLRTGFEAHYSLLGRRPRLYKSLEEAARRYQRGNPHCTLASCMQLIERGTKHTQSDDDDGSGDGDTRNVVYRHDPRLRAITPLHVYEEASRAVIQNITCPMLVVLGSKRGEVGRSGRYVRRVNQKRMDLVKDRLTLLDCDVHDHHLHLNQPELIVESVHNFLQRTARANSRDSKL